MSEKLPSRSPEPSSELSPEANARRLMMLKGLGRGSAVVSAAALPLSALSQGSTLLLTPTGKGGEAAGLRCSVSGMQSQVANSRVPSDARTCGGYSPGWWGQETQTNGKVVPRRTWPIDYKTKVSQLFTRCASDDPGMSSMFTNGVTLFDVMRDPKFASTKTRHWIGAYLNGLAGGVPGFPFPYSGTEVMKFYNTMDQKRDQFYALVVTYLEIHN